MALFSALPFCCNPKRCSKSLWLYLRFITGYETIEQVICIYCPPTLIDREDSNTRELIPGSWKDDLPPQSLLPLQPALVHNYTSEANEMRQEFTRWFSDERDVEWQRRMCGL